MKTHWAVLSLSIVMFGADFVLAAAYPEPFPIYNTIAQQPNNLQFEIESDLLKASAVKKESAYCTLGGLIGCSLK